MEILTKEESYVERRQLFKDIWDTAMQIDEKDPDIMSKPRVIKTLRLDEVDKCVIGKKKKERIKNLRTVCTKILDFCDRQDADDTFYEQMAGGPELPSEKKADVKPKKLKPHRGKKKIKKAKSLFTPLTGAKTSAAHAKPTTSERKDDLKLVSVLKKTSRNMSPIKFNKTSVIRRALVTTFKPTTGPRTLRTSETLPSKGSAKTPRRKVVKKKRSKRKKPSESADIPPASAGIIEWPEQ